MQKSLELGQKLAGLRRQMKEAGKMSEAEEQHMTRRLDEISKFLDYDSLCVSELVRRMGEEYDEEEDDEEEEEEEDDPFDVDHEECYHEEEEEEGSYHVKEEMIDAYTSATEGDEWEKWEKDDDDDEEEEEECLGNHPDGHYHGDVWIWLNPCKEEEEEEQEEYVEQAEEGNGCNMTQEEWEWYQQANDGNQEEDEEECYEDDGNMRRMAR